MRTDIREALDSDQKTWDSTVNHPLQTWSWGQFRKKTGAIVKRLVVPENSVPAVGWQITFHRVPFTSFTVGYFPKGPEMTQRMIDTLFELGKKHNALYIQVEPNAEATKENRTETERIVKRKCPIVQPSHHPLFTKYSFILDLTRTEDALLAEMHPKTRYNIKVAQKHGVSVQEDSSKHTFDEYLRLTGETTSRQGFYAHNTTYHSMMWDTMHEAGIARMYKATLDKVTLAAWIVFGHKDMLYYPYGASSRTHREVMAPTLLLWEIMRRAKQKGYKSFDLWGAIGPNPDTKDPWYGFHRFKEGFHPRLAEYIGSYDLIIHPVLYRLFVYVNSIRWTLLKILRSRSF